MPCGKLSPPSKKRIIFPISLLLERSFRVLQIHWPRFAQLLPAYTVGGLGAYGTLQRVLIMVAGLR